MPRRANVFYAYPSSPPAIGETIEQANKGLAQNSEIKKARVRFSTWTDSVVSGKLLWRDIEDRIQRSQVFACDLTYPNPNVSFELGFAIGRFKRCCSRAGSFNNDELSKSVETTLTQTRAQAVPATSDITRGADRLNENAVCQGRHIQAEWHDVQRTLHAKRRLSM